MKIRYIRDCYGWLVAGPAAVIVTYDFLSTRRAAANEWTGMILPIFVVLTGGILIRIFFWVKGEIPPLCVYWLQVINAAFLGSLGVLTYFLWPHDITWCLSACYAALMAFLIMPASGHWFSDSEIARSVWLQLFFGTATAASAWFFVSM